MQVLIDGAPLAHSASTFTDALEAARIETNRLGRVIIGIEVDGAAWSPGATGSPAAEQMNGRDVRLFTHDPRSLVGRTLLDVADLLKATGPQHHDAAILIQSGKLGEGMKLLGQTISAWESARTAITQCAALLGTSVEKLLSLPGASTPTAAKTHADPAGSGPPGETAVGSGLIHELTNSLQEVKRAVKDNDWSGLADVLEYEMAELCTTWQGVVTAAARRVGA